MWSSFLKIQYTELKLSCGNGPVVKNSIYSNGDLDLWHNNPKINRVLPLSRGNHVAMFGKDPIYRTKIIVRKPVWMPARHTQSHNTAPSRDGRIKTVSLELNKNHQHSNNNNIFYYSDVDIYRLNVSLL